MSYKILAGSLVAHPDNHGTHLQNYINNKQQIARVLCENLILHDQICIPIQDYYTACGLIYILGEKNFLSLLEAEKIKFLRYKKRIGFVKAINKPGELCLITADKTHPSVCDHDESIAKGIGNLAIMMQLKSRKNLESLLLSSTDSVDIEEHFKFSKKNASDVFNQTALSTKSFNDFLKWSSVKQPIVTTLSSAPIDTNNPIQVMLGLMMVSYEAQLMKKYECSSSASTLDLNNLIGLPQYGKLNDGEKLWAITKSRKIPDLGKLALSSEDYFKKIIGSSISSNASQFRKWFHENNGLNAEEIQREFNCFVEYVPWHKTFFGSVICWGSVFLTGCAYGTLVGLSQELLLKLLGCVKSESPRYFIHDLQKKFKL